MKFTITLIMFVFCAIMIVGCEGEEGKRGLPAPLLTGNISGTVIVANSNNASGVEVKLVETSQTTISDSSGNWLLKDVKAGIYTLEFNKLDYGTSKLLNYQFVGGGTSRLPSNIALTKIPFYSAKHLEIFETPKDDAGQLSCIIEFTPQAPSNEQRIFRLYYSKDKNFSPTSSNYFYTNTVSGNLNNPYSELTVRTKGITNTLKNKLASSTMLPFNKGDTVYVVACASGISGSAPQTTGSGYYDFSNFSQFVYTDISSPSNTVSFILP